MSSLPQISRPHEKGIDFGGGRIDVAVGCVRGIRCICRYAGLVERLSRTLIYLCSAERHENGSACPRARRQRRVRHPRALTRSRLSIIKSAPSPSLSRIWAFGERNLEDQQMLFSLRCAYGMHFHQTSRIFTAESGPRRSATYATLITSLFRPHLGRHGIAESNGRMPLTGKTIASR